MKKVPINQTSIHNLGQTIFLKISLYQKQITMVSLLSVNKSSKIFHNNCYSSEIILNKHLQKLFMFETFFEKRQPDGQFNVQHVILFIIIWIKIHTVLEKNIEYYYFKCVCLSFIIQSSQKRKK